MANWLPEDVAGALSIDATSRGLTALTSALPWPLSWLADRLQGDRLAALKVATRPNPYTTAPSGAQMAIASGQARARALRGGLPGLSGSESEWDHDQGMSSVDTHGFGGQDLTSAAIPPSRFLPWSVQHPRDENTTRGYTGPVLTPGSPLIRWGSGTRFAAPRIVAGTLLPPGARTPTPAEMVAGFVDQNPAGLRIDDPYNDPEDM